MLVECEMWTFQFPAHALCMMTPAHHARMTRAGNLAGPYSGERLSLDNGGASREDIMPEYVRVIGVGDLPPGKGQVAEVNGRERDL